MSCNYLIRAECEEKFEHFIIDGCNNGNAGGAVLKYFMMKNPTVKVSNFIEEVGALDVCTTFWIKYLVGVAIFEDKYNIYVGKQQVMKDYKLGMVSENLQEVTAITGRLLESKPPKLLPYFEKDV